jgi:hypothetical protein
MNAPTSLNQVVQVLAEIVRNADRPVHGAKLADELKAIYPDFDYSDVGCQKLADLVKKGEELGLLHRRKEVGHLLVEPGLSLPKLDAGSSSIKPTYAQVEQQNNWLRDDVWKAFVFLSATESYVLDRESGAVTQVPLAELDSVSDDSSKVVLSSISSETQKQWAESFLKAIGKSSDSIFHRDDRWWISWKEFLQEGDDAVRAKWAEYRRERVLDYVKSWAAENGVPKQLLFSRNDKKLNSDSFNHDRIPDLLSKSDANKYREAIKSIISDMSLNDLDKLEIPLVYIRKYFVAR